MLIDLKRSSLIALVDCNNFYASCERVFRPDLEGKPIIVLSNNGGCVVARSAEVKALGIKMGEPLFKLHEQIRAHDIQVFSSNYTLYGDLSWRVMEALKTLSALRQQHSNGVIARDRAIKNGHQDNDGYNIASSGS